MKKKKLFGCTLLLLALPSAHAVFGSYCFGQIAKKWHGTTTRMIVIW
jgi:hypothetical protein